MARMRRLVVPGFPHHVTQRGNRRQRTFFSTEDYYAYASLISQARVKADIEIWAYCLMPNHVHFVVVPHDENGLAELFKEAHRRYTRRINLRHNWRGHLWQERFHSFVMDEPHLMAAVRYVEQNPVRAGFCSKPDEWRWSSAKAHLDGVDDQLVSVAPMLARSSDWESYLGTPDANLTVETIRRHSSTGRPAGSNLFIQMLEERTGRSLFPKVAGRKQKAKPGVVEK